MHVLCVTFGQKFLGDNFAASFGSFQTTFFRTHTHNTGGPLSFSAAAASATASWGTMVEEDLPLT